MIVPITSGRAHELRTLLDSIGAAVEDSDLVPFPKITTLHFARWVILPEQSSVVGHTVFPAQLVLSTNYDGPLDQHLDEFIRVARSGIDVIYDHCVGYPDPADRTPAAIAAYLRAHAVDHAIFYVGAPGVTATRIHQEARLRDRIEAILDERGHATDHWADWTPPEVYRAVREHVRGEETLEWALESPGPPVRTLPWYGWVGVTAVAILLLPVIALALVVIRVRELAEERNDATGGVTSSAALSAARRDDLDTSIQKVTEREDVQIQNQLSHVVEIKPGWVRWAALRAVLPVLNFGARHIYNQGSLFGVSTLHFVRWVLIDGGRRLMFLTNYDGSMIGYVGDFVNKSWQIPSALTAIWSNTVGFPPTRWLLLRGARDVRRFTAFLRDHQVVTQTWYSAYKRTTTGNIINNAHIRRGLAAAPPGDAFEEWLRRL